MMRDCRRIADTRLPSSLYGMDQGAGISQQEDSPLGHLTNMGRLQQWA
jgi:hypothetical protein